MKVAAIHVRTASGWHTLAVGEDITTIKGLFREIKGAGHCTIAGQPADLVYLFDSAGGVRRKFLKDPAAQAAVAAANGRQSQREADAAAAAQARLAATNATAKAAKVASAAAKVIVDAVRGEGAVPADETLPAADDNAAYDDADQAANDSVSDESDDEAGDPAAHFAAGGKAARKIRNPKTSAG